MQYTTFCSEAMIVMTVVVDEPVVEVLQMNQVLLLVEVTIHEVVTSM